MRWKPEKRRKRKQELALMLAPKESVQKQNKKAVKKLQDNLNLIYPKLQEGKYEWEEVEVRSLLEERGEDKRARKGVYAKEELKARSVLLLAGIPMGTKNVTIEPRKRWTYEMGEQAGQTITVPKYEEIEGWPHLALMVNEPQHGSPNSILTQDMLITL